MREHIRYFATICAEHLDLLNPMVEFGSFQVRGQEGYADMRRVFKYHQYVGTDLRRGTGVDGLVDMSAAGLRSDSVGTAVSFDTIEHVEDLRESMAEVYRVLRPDGGLFIVTSVMDFEIHEHPLDYWRFTPYGHMSLLKGFDLSLVFTAGPPIKPHTVVGVGLKGPTQSRLPAFVGAMADWRERVEW